MTVEQASPPAFLLPVFRAVAHVEALSWAGLLTGMVLKYLVASQADLGSELVSWFGMVHGVLVMVYVALAWNVGRAFRWPLATTALALLAAIPPFATVVFDRWALGSGRYGGGMR